MKKLLLILVGATLLLYAVFHLYSISGTPLALRDSIGISEELIYFVILGLFGTYFILHGIFYSTHKLFAIDAIINAKIFTYIFTDAKVGSNIFVSNAARYLWRTLAIGALSFWIIPGLLFGVFGDDSGSFLSWLTFITILLIYSSLLFYFLGKTIYFASLAFRNRSNNFPDQHI